MTEPCDKGINQDLFTTTGCRFDLLVVKSLQVLLFTKMFIKKLHNHFSNYFDTHAIQNAKYFSPLLTLLQRGRNAVVDNIFEKKKNCNICVLNGSLLPISNLTKRFVNYRLQLIFFGIGERSVTSSNLHNYFICYINMTK